jgi:hypothetical protein
LQKNISFVHIPKCAGTSLTGSLIKLFTRENCYLIGEDCNSFKIYPQKSLMNQKRYVAGHKDIGFFRGLENRVVLSILRDPYSRTLSLFNYYTKPELATTKHEQRARQNQLKRWVKLGINPTSLELSILGCRKFRYEINNAMCRYLSFSQASRFWSVIRDHLLYTHTFNFETAKNAIQSIDCIIGTQDNLNVFEQELKKVINNETLLIQQLNIGMTDKTDKNILTSQEKELILQLNQDDLKLFTFIKKQPDGLFTNICY